MREIGSRQSAVGEMPPSAAFGGTSPRFAGGGWAPASLADYAALFPGRGRRFWRAAAVQILSGPAWTLWRGGKPVLVCGLYPLHSGILEAWLMMPRPPSLAELRELVRRAEAVLPERIVIARVDDANVAGQRLAVMAGFLPIDEWLAGTRKRTWVRQTTGNVTRAVGDL